MCNVQRMATTILGLLGRKQSGKDTFAQRLVTEHGFTRLAFADPLKDLAYEVNPVIAYDEIEGEHFSLRDAVDFLGWDVAKETYPSVRQYIQNLGVGVRNHVVQNAWVQALAERAYLTPGPVVVTDCRFPNEAAWVRGQGGETVRILRSPSVTRSVDEHVSETALDAWVTDHVVHNDSTIPRLHETADFIAAYVTTPSVARLRARMVPPLPLSV
jgi:hypothetical protein